MSNEVLEKLSRVASVILLGVAGVLYVYGESDKAFIAVVFSAVMFLVGYRIEVKERLRKRAEEGDSPIAAANDEEEE
ncbi:MAG: hypothetical protein R2684_14805 [Pyrinomonadaceae bacterium]